jgi:isopenicillin N synthase-like dioxygenase
VRVSTEEFDPVAKEDALRAESETWDTTHPVEAEPGDIPVIDLQEYFATGADSALQEASKQLAAACETVGFWQLVGHDISPGLIADTFDAVARFHELPLDTKQHIRMDRADWPLRGVGYLPVGERKLPRRAKGNLNEAFLMKRSRDIGDEDNQWLIEADAPGFRAAALRYANAVEDLALRLLPVYATALGVEKDFFAPGFDHPFWRLRMTHYPADTERSDNDGFGIAPHVDTTFFTLLLQDSPGLTIYSTPRDQWIKAPVVDNAFVVNSGELLKQWTNDRYLSVRHFANVTGDESRYSIPFFFNATADYPMTCVPTCCSETNPAKYPPISYDESQAVVQGE